MTYISKYQSPIGTITLSSDGKGLTGLWFDGQKYYGSTISDETKYDSDLDIFGETKRWLDIYFSGSEPDFCPRLSLKGSDFRESVWRILRTIPCGATMTYGEIAKKIAKEKGIKSMSAQAVGGAVGQNPISIIVPCHRVIGSDGSMTGYAGGIERKKWLLEHENNLARR